MRLSVRTSGVRPLISLTPLIDVVFILLVFFMLVSSLTQWTSVTLETAGGSSRAKPAELPLVLTLRHNGSLEWEGREIDMASLTTRLMEVAAENADRPVLVRADVGVPLQQLVTVLDGIGRAGLTRVSVARKDGD